MPVTTDFDYCFAENGLTAIKLGETLESQSFINFLGEAKYHKLVKFILHYIADLEIPVKRSACTRDLGVGEREGHGADGRLRATQGHVHRVPKRHGQVCAGRANSDRLAHPLV